MTTERRQRKHPNLRRGAPAKSTVQAGEGAAKNAKWKPGQSGNPAGRKKGVPTKATRDIKLFAQSVLEDPVVQERVRDDARRGRLAPPNFALLCHYAYGKPKDTLKVEGLERLQIIIKDGDEPEPEPHEQEAGDEE